MSYTLNSIRVFTYDFAPTLAFYRDTIGLPVNFSDDDMGWAQFDVGGPSLLLERCERGDPEAAELVGRFVGVSLEVEDIDATYRALLDRGVSFSSEPTRQAWGGVLAHFEDPAGNVVTLLGR